MFVRLSDAELIEDSELIVVGELIGRAPINSSQGNGTQMLGVIRVDETLKGERGTTIAFLGLPGGKIMRSDDLSYGDGQRGLWYLRLRDADEAGIYVADHPQRFVPMDQAGGKIETLRSLQL